MASPVSISPPSGSHGAGSKRYTNEIKVIQELFQDYNALGYKQALAELDQALIDMYPTIVIEPLRLGDDTARWILVGNLLHRTTVWGGIGGCLGVALLPDSTLLWLPVPLATVSLGAFVAYTASWMSDPCRNYQVETDKQRLAALNLNNLSSSNSVIVLTLTDDFKRRCVHSAVALLTASVFSYRMYKYFCST
uniref:Uncharacterized protein n=1 Tax=Plectus sambesii TaxID=2011161 RepID=A0A914WK20_9BILA